MSLLLVAPSIIRYGRSHSSRFSHRSVRALSGAFLTFLTFLAGPFGAAHAHSGAFLTFLTFLAGPFRPPTPIQGLF